MGDTKVEPRVKVSKLEIGESIFITRNGRPARTEFISEIAGECVCTLTEPKKGEITKTTYLITRDEFQTDGEIFLSFYMSRRIRKGEEDYAQLNKELEDYLSRLQRL